MSKMTYKSILVIAGLALLISCEQPTAIQPSLEAGDRYFWVNDAEDSSGWTQIGTVLAYEGVNCNVWIRTNEQAKISDALLDEYGAYFDNESWPEVTDYVFTPAEFFGEPGDRINIVFYTMADSIAGYFWVKDFYTNEDLAYFGSSLKSNESNVFYLNIDAAKSVFNQPRATLFTKGTLTHEFQHLCNAQYFYYGDGSTKEREMDSWANEFCSTTIESVHADQYAIYLNDYINDYSGDFAAGRTDFLLWGTGYSQYISTSLLGGHILSKMDPVNHGNLVKEFLYYTHQEDTTDSEYDPDSFYASAALSSVEDLLMTLQSAAVNYDNLSGWSPISNPAMDLPDIQNNWSLLMKGYLTALTGKDPDFLTYIKSVTTEATPNSISPPLAAEGTTSVSLKSSAHLIARTRTTPDFNSTSIGAAQTTGTDAYALVWNGSIPSYAALSSELSLPSGTASFVPGAVLPKPVDPLASPAARSMREPFAFNRANTKTLSFSRAVLEYTLDSIPVFARDTAISGVGDSSNPSDGAGGNLYCAFIEY